jgi:hypothetical protein
VASRNLSRQSSSSQGSIEYVPLAPFQDAFRRLQEREGLTVADVASRMGADRELTARRLAGKPWSARAKTLKSGEVRVYPGSVPERVKYDVAVGLCRALGLWPVDCGV